MYHATNEVPSLQLMEETTAATAAAASNGLTIVLGHAGSTLVQSFARSLPGPGSRGAVLDLVAGLGAGAGAGGGGDDDDAHALQTVSTGTGAGASKALLCVGATPRSTRVASCPALCCCTVRNPARSSPHSSPAVAHLTVAARGLAYMSASSPKHGWFPSVTA